MALFGFQLVLTMIMAAVMQKISSRYSFGRWLVCSTQLKWFLPPGDGELHALAGHAKEKKKKKDKVVENDENDKTFTVPRNLDIKLNSRPVSLLDVMNLKYYIDYQWLVDFSLYAFAVYIITEIYYSFYHRASSEMNLSTLWCVILLGYAGKLLFSTTSLYFKSEQAQAERTIVILSGCTYFVLSLALLIVDERKLELGLDSAYDSFNESANEFLQVAGMDSDGVASKLILKLCVAVWCGISASLITFPGFRLSRMHWEALKLCQDKPFWKILLHGSFIMPFLIILMWVRPLTREYFTERIFSGRDAPFMTNDAFDTLRILLIIVFCISRVVLLPKYLQAYLNSAEESLKAQKQEAGRISNVDLQVTVARPFHYLFVVSLQILAPIIVTLCFTLLYKTMGGYSWVGQAANEKCTEGPPLKMPEDPTVENAREQFVIAMAIFRRVFTRSMFRGLLGFATWWSSFLIFASSALGVAYCSYFTAN